MITISPFADLHWPGVDLRESLQAAAHLHR